LQHWQLQLRQTICTRPTGSTMHFLQLSGIAPGIRPVSAACPGTFRAVCPTMARPLRIQFPGAIYHVVARGNARQQIFLQDTDRRRFLEELWRTCDLKNWLVWAYCLMNNHFHLILETAEPTLASGMRDLEGRYALEFNRRYGRVGHLFQSRYKAFLVQRERYLFQLTRYVVLNPVRANLCAAPEDWRWSSYRDVVGLRTGAAPRLAVSATLSLFGDRVEESRQAYKTFVYDGIGQAPPKPHPDHPLVYGDDDFLSAVTAGVADTSTEIPRAQRLIPSLREVAARAPNRDEAIRLAHATGQFKLTEIGDLFGLHYATVSRIINRANATTAVDDVAMQDLTP
jgi:REP element-mobilizing transposase RayT